MPAFLVISAATCALAEEEVDMHFRAFAIEPADRVEWGSGHVTLGVERAIHRHADVDGKKHVRTATPMEWTIGLPGGFSVSLSREINAGMSGEQGWLPGERAERDVLLRYAMPLGGRTHLALLAGASRTAGEKGTTVGYGMVGAFDSDFGHFGSGLAWGQKRDGEAHRPWEAGINWFHLLPSGWGPAAEVRWGRDGEGRAVGHQLFGVAWKVGRSVLLDISAGQSVGAQQEKRLGLGVSWFY